VIEILSSVSRVLLPIAFFGGLAYVCVRLILSNGRALP
jgi:hypothetical protein